MSTDPFLAARNELRQAELELMQQRERVAALRRALPPGPPVEDRVFDTADGPRRHSELFTGPDRPLITYHFMFGKGQAEPCPMCSMWADAWNGVADHIGQLVDFVLVSSAPIDETMTLAEQRGWTDLRWASAADNDFKAAVGGEDETGNQSPFISVWDLADGQPRLTYSGAAHIAEDHWRGLDLLSPVWHLLDLTSSGRGDWFPALTYD